MRRGGGTGGGRRTPISLLKRQGSGHLSYTRKPDRRPRPSGASDRVGGTGFEPAVPEAAGLQPAARPLAHPSHVGGTATPQYLASIRLPGRATAGSAEQLPAVGWRPGLSMFSSSASDGRSRDVGSRTPAHGFGDRRASVTPHPLGGPWPCCAPCPRSLGSDGRYQRTPGCPGRMAFAHPRSDFTLVDRRSSPNGRDDAPATLNRAVPWSGSAVR